MTDSPKISCNNCAFENPEDAKFCQNCGNPLMLPCPECNTLNSAGVKFCKNCGHALTETTPADQEPRLQALKQAAPKVLQEKIRTAKSEIDGERKPVTILFADIVGSTAMAEQLDPEEWKEIVNGAHQRMSEAIYRYEGTIAQLLGDGLLAFFGAPITHEDDPIRAVLAAKDIQEQIQDYEHALKGVVEQFQLRIGINSGNVVVGDIGSDLHVEYLAIGDAVNIAARLQSNAQPGKILLAESTARFVQAAFEMRDCGEIQLKGKTTPLSVYEVIKPKAVTDRTRGIKGLESPLIGRIREMDLLQGAILSLSEGRGQIISLMGEAGIGKTRLLEEVRFGASGKSVEGDTHLRLRWLEGRSLSYGAGLPFWPIAQLLLSDLGLSNGDPEIRIKAALRRRVSELFGPETVDVLPFLLHLLGLRLSEDEQVQVQRLDSETLRHQVLNSLQKYFEHIAIESPTALIFEDLHWADPSSLDTIEMLLPITDRAPLMILMVMRIDREHGSHNLKMMAESEYAHRFSEIELKRLPPEDSDLLVNNLLEVADLPPSIRDLILTRSDGNPFYLEEIIRNLIDQGVLQQQGEKWRASEGILEVTIPDTLQGVLLARIDRLEEEVRSTLQIASVIGKNFLYRLLEAISAAEQQLDLHLTALQRADLVREKTRWPELEYMFKHALTQEAAYQSLLVERRKKFHLQVGNAIEELFSDREEEFLGLLAHHFEAAEEVQRALKYILLAGDKARLDDTVSEAIEYYQRALDIIDQESESQIAYSTWLKLALIHQRNFDFDAARNSYEAAFNLEQALAPPRQAVASDQFSEKPKVLSFSNSHKVFSLDPGKSFWVSETSFLKSSFSGLAEMDSESNVVPHVARYWEVLDEGKRYIFHLRDDVFWTDGSQVTAFDFEWAWKRNLAPETEAEGAPILDDVIGARSFRLGETADPDTVGVRALDNTTFEVRLERPIAYFIYLVVTPFTFPLPRAIVEKFGDDWWQPENVVTNGAFRLTFFDGNKIEYERNYSYFAPFPGNLDGLQWRLIHDKSVQMDEYISGASNVLLHINPGHFPSDLLEEEIQFPSHDLGLRALVFNPSRPPMNDIRVRRAIAHALDRKLILDEMGIPARRDPRGGIVPIGLSGHSPEIGLLHNLDLARQYLEDAGYPMGRGLPEIELTHSNLEFKGGSFQKFAKDKLGIEIRPTYIEGDDNDLRYSGHIFSSGWGADYPDPDNFLQKSTFVSALTRNGWQDPQYDALIEEAAVVQDRNKRLKMYRQADKLLVNDQVLVYPIGYGGEGAFADLVKPWVKNFKRDSLGYVRFKDITIEQEEETSS
jgi:ABC-type oligopeptide transport system substrate-binding subunit/class 3 adenylate cyclase